MSTDLSALCEFHRGVRYALEGWVQNGPDLDLWQYRLSARGNGRTVAGLSLEVGPDLPLIDLRDHEGRDVGVLLGHPTSLPS